MESRRTDVSYFFSPPDLPLSHTAEALVTIGSGIAVVAAFAVAIRYWRTAGSAVPIFLLIGAGIATVNEPLVDLLGNCFHNGAAQWRLFELFDRPIPIWGLFGYVIVYGVTAWFILSAMQRGASRLQFWLVLGAMMLIQVAMEMVILPTNLYYYYGYQPWSFFGMPMYWLALNFAGTVLTAAVLSLTWHHLIGRRQAWVLLLPMATQIVGSYFIGLPVFASLHSGGPAVVLWVGGAVTIALAAVAVDFLAAFVRSRVPAPSLATTKVRAR